MAEIEPLHHLLDAARELVAVAIRHAELAGEARRCQAWQHATTNIATRLLAGQPPQAVLATLTRYAMRLAGAAAAAVAGPAEDPALLRVICGTGLLDPRLVGELIPAQGSIAQLALGSGTTVVTDDVASPGTPCRAAPAPAPGLGPVVAVPIGTGAGGGVLLLARTREESPFQPADVEMITAFARQAGRALALAGERTRGELQRLVEDRERIATHLSEHAMRELLGISTTMHGLSTRMPSAADAQRLTDQADRLDTVLRDMQQAIFALHRSTA
ncbi:MAG TPA: GAF domain-containing protein [Pseudonocardiaceae bacterium]|jgi:GAF domain-containing protein|nr:GAF domain-containing protein [Pseudonocardiaceae bacterium]